MVKINRADVYDTTWALDVRANAYRVRAKAFGAGLHSAALRGHAASCERVCAAIRKAVAE